MGTILVIDTATRRIQAGILRGGGWDIFVSEEGEALEKLFEVLEKVIGGLKGGLKEVDEVWFCDGPGSLLGIRIGAIAIRGWQAMGELREGVKVGGYNGIELYESYFRKVGKEGLVAKRLKVGNYVVKRGEEWLEVDEEGLKGRSERIYLIDGEGDSVIGGTIEGIGYDVKLMDGIYKDVKVEYMEKPDAKLFRQQQYVQWDYKK